MASVNARLLDEAIDHEVDLRLYQQGVAYRMIAILNRSDSALVAQLAEAMMRLEADSFTVERLEAMLASVRALNAQAYAQVFGQLEPELRALAEVEAAYQARLLRDAVPAAVQLRFPLASVSADQVYAAAMSQPFQGRLLSGWAANLGESRLGLIANTIRTGFVTGQTTADIVRLIRGTKARRYEDGILNRSRRELQTIVQTALAHTAQTARDQFVQANADIVKAVKWVSTLDGRTSPMCRVRDGLVYTATKPHKPIGHKVPWGQGPGRLHFNCRSVSAPVTKSWRELGIESDELPASTRASMDGQVPADTTYAEWFARLPAERQDEIVGPTRGALYRAGRATFQQFTDDRGVWLTLDQLRQRLGL